MGTARARTQASGLTLDAGALIALERGDRRIIALLERAVENRVALRVPAGVVGQAWRDRARQVTLGRFLRLPEVDVRPLDEPLARACGELCAVSGTADVIDASVVLVARENRDTVLTADVADLRRLDRTLRVERV